MPRLAWFAPIALLALLQFFSAVSASCVYNMSNTNVNVALDCGVFCLHYWNTEPGEPSCSPGVGGTLTILNGYLPPIVPNENGLDFKIDDHGYLVIYRLSPEVMQFCSYRNDDTLITCKTANPDVLNPSIPTL